MTHTTLQPPQFPSIIELSKVDSTNNYALQQIREGLAYHGQAIFAHEQFAGKGQWGKSWETQPAQNIHLSIILEPKQLKPINLFALSALVAVETRNQLALKTNQNFLIKWPNDIYFQDRKAGGILIENILSGQNWKWAVVGIGINMNQEVFPKELAGAISLRQITGEKYDCVNIATQLAEKILQKFSSLEGQLEKEGSSNLYDYNRFLFKKDLLVDFVDGNGAAFKARVKSVTSTGKLELADAPKPEYDFGELRWNIL